MNEKEKFQPHIKSTKISEEIPSREDYLKQALENLQITSRTAKGVVDVSASLDKSKEIQEGLNQQEVADRATMNFK